MAAAAPFFSYNALCALVSYEFLLHLFHRCPHILTLNLNVLELRIYIELILSSWYDICIGLLLCICGVSCTAHALEAWAGGKLDGVVNFNWLDYCSMYGSLPVYLKNSPSGTDEIDAVRPTYIRMGIIPYWGTGSPVRAS